MHTAAVVGYSSLAKPARSAGVSFHTQAILLIVTKSYTYHMLNIKPISGPNVVIVNLVIYRTSLSITDENRDKKYDERGDIVAADVGLRHSALRVRMYTYCR